MSGDLRDVPRETSRLGRFGELVPISGFSRASNGMQGRVVGVSVWVSHDGLLITSGCHSAPLPGTDGTIGPQWLVAVSRRGRGRENRRASDDDVRRVVTAFAMPAFDEDNHHPGIARHLWCPHDAAAQRACECKISETLIVEPDGYQWTNDDSQPCRGCEYEKLLGMPCTIHSQPT